MKKLIIISCFLFFIVDNRTALSQVVTGNHIPDGTTIEYSPSFPKVAVWYSNLEHIDDAACTASYASISIRGWNSTIGDFDLANNDSTEPFFNTSYFLDTPAGYNYSGVPYPDIVYIQVVIQYKNGTYTQIDDSFVPGYGTYWFIND